MRVKRNRNVLVVLWLAGSAGRKQLSGILRHVNDNSSWSVRLITEPKEFTGEAIRKAAEENVDGFIVHADTQAAEGLVSSRIPTVLIDYPPPKLATRTHSLTAILDNDEEIGQVAAEYFLRLGNFASYAFVPDLGNRGWSRLRERGYKTALLKHDTECHVFGIGKGPLSDWLRALPKPAAVLCAYDLRAQETLEACRQARLSVPGQVSLLGVDNDELICDSAKPSLSSVRIDHEAVGFEAARMLERLMDRPNCRKVRKVLMPTSGVVERESTAPIQPAVHLVNRALNYIKSHAAEPISVTDVVRHLGVSRRLADRRFGAATGSSIRRAIEDCRLDMVKRRLKETSMSIAKISRLCGYPNVQRLKYVFKMRFGQSMSEWRKQHADRKS